MMQYNKSGQQTNKNQLTVFLKKWKKWNFKTRQTSYKRCRVEQVLWDLCQTFWQVLSTFASHYQKLQCSAEWVRPIFINTHQHYTYLHIQTQWFS